MTKLSTLSIHEKVLVKLFNQNEQLTLFDIGACEGLSSLKYLTLFPFSLVYAFEPVPKNFELILKNKEKFKLKNLNAFQIGLSSSKEKSTFYLSSGKPPNKDKPLDNSIDFGNKSSSLYRPDKTKEVHPWLKFNETITIQTDTLDNFCSDKNISSIDFIHMDVRGAELLVLEGGKKILPKIKGIWLEVEKITLYEKQALKKDIELFLLKHNFICILNKVNHISGDQFWIKKDFFDKKDKQTKIFLFYLKAKVQLKSIFSTFFGQISYNIKKLMKI